MDPVKKIDIAEYLKSLPKDETVYYYPNPGNGGDSMIACATFQLFQRLGIKYRIANDIRQSFKNKIFIYAGGGNLTRYYNHAANVLKKVIKDDPARIIILSHTIDAHKDLIERFSGNTDIICRDLVSYQYVKGAARNANVLLADDMIFCLDTKKVIRKNILFLLAGYIFAYKPGGRIRSAARRAIDGTRKLWTIHCLLKRYNHDILYAFRTDSEKTDINTPDDNVDLSLLIKLGTYPEPTALLTSYLILTTVNHFKEIKTNRLHIALAGALLKKKVFLYPDSYYKNEAVYHNSLKGTFPNVLWMGQGEER